MAINLFNKHKQYAGMLTANGQTRNTFEATIPHGTKLEDVLAVTYWWRVSRSMKPLDEIRCVWEDGSRVATLRIMERPQQSSQTVLVALVPGLQFEYPNPEMPAGHELRFVNADIGWQVFRTPNQSPLASGFPTALAAARWLTADVGEEGLETLPASKELADGAKSGGAKGGAKLPKPETQAAAT